MAATEYLFERSARQFRGLCTSVVRPCTRAVPCGHRLSYDPPRACGCGSLSEIDLGLWPVVEVLEVRQDGVLVPSGSYRVDNWRLLVRLPDPDGTEASWPACQRLDLAPTEEGTLQFTVRHGQAPPALGVVAARALACELAKACAGVACVLPTRVTSVARMGVTTKRADPDKLPDGRTGLQAVDLFLSAYNPRKLQSGATVWSPDTSPRGRRAGT